MDFLTPDAALALAERHWRIHGDICALPSYADQNFRIRTDHGEYVLKIAHPSWSRMDVDLENRAMMTLAEREPALQWPRVQLAVDGGHLLTLPMAGQPCQVRMLSFVPGTTYADAIGALPPIRRAALHESLGSAVGRLTRGLQDFHHPAADRQHDWNLLRLPTLRGEIAHVEDAGLRAIVQAHVEAFCARLPQWRTIVQGYLAQCPLLRVELEQLRRFILARLCHSVLMATRAHREDPANPFVLVSQQGVQALLRELADADDDALAGPFPESSHD